MGTNYKYIPDARYPLIQNGKVVLAANKCEVFATFAKDEDAAFATEALNEMFRSGAVLHIGKSSCGWCFGLHVELNQPGHPTNLEDWIKLFDSGGYIQDEYGNVITKEKMLEIICKRDRHKPVGYVPDAAVQRAMGEEARYLDDVGLWSHGWHCVGHTGTYDLVTGYFS